MPKSKKSAAANQGDTNDDRVSDLCQVLELQQSAISILRQEMQCLEHNVASCSAEMAVLKECLMEASVVSPMRLLVHMHRRQFRSMCAKHGFLSERGLLDVISIRDVALILCRAIGSESMLVAGAVCQLCGRALPRAVGTPSRVLDSIYICGGQEAGAPKTSVESFSVEYGEWEVLPPMSHQRRGAMAGIIGERLYVCGGHDGEEPINSSECFDLTRRAWEVAPEMLAARWGAGTGIIGKRMYLCGGNVRGEAAQSVEFFDEELNVWSAAPHMLEARRQPAATVLNGCLVICGGYDTSERPVVTVERYMPLDGVWEALPPMLEPRGRSIAGAISGKVYVCGGRKSGMQCYKSMECLEQVVPDVGHRIRLSSQGRQVPDDYDWSEDPLCPGEIGEVLEVEGSQAYIKGPREEEAWYLLEHLETFEWSWTSAPPMSAGRVDAAGVAAGGSLYVFGGWDGKQRLRSAERFDPLVGTWVAIAPMREQRMLQVAVVAAQC